MQIPIHCLFAFASASQFYIYLWWVNQERALIGASSVIVKTDGSFAALFQSQQLQSHHLTMTELWPGWLDIDILWG